MNRHKMDRKLTLIKIGQFSRKSIKNKEVNFCFFVVVFWLRALNLLYL